MMPDEVFLTAPRRGHPGAGDRRSSVRTAQTRGQLQFALPRRRVRACRAARPLAHQPKYPLRRSGVRRLGPSAFCRVHVKVAHGTVCALLAVLLSGAPPRQPGRGSPIPGDNRPPSSIDPGDVISTARGLWPPGNKRTARGSPMPSRRARRTESPTRPNRAEQGRLLKSGAVSPGGQVHCGSEVASMAVVFPPADLLRRCR